MGRKKVNIQYIADAASRRTTFMKRHRGIIKKVRELSILCDVKACAVIYAQDDTNAVVWPNKNEAMETLQCFKDLPEFEQGKKMLNQEGFINQCLLKKQDQVLRHRRENEDLMMTLIVTEELAGRNFHGLNVDETTTLADFVERKANEVHLHIEVMKPRIVKTVTADGRRGKAAMDAVARETNWCMEMPKPNGPTFFKMEHLVQPYSGGGHRLVGPFNPF